jgi:cytochrome c biogenesis protein ResB
MKFKRFLFALFITSTICCFIINDFISNWSSFDTNTRNSNPNQLMVMSKVKNIDVLNKSSPTSSKKGKIKNYVYFSIYKFIFRP